jgi:hypothetical protein
MARISTLCELGGLYLHVHMYMYDGISCSVSGLVLGYSLFRSIPLLTNITAYIKALMLDKFGDIQIAHLKSHRHII